MARSDGCMSDSLAQPKKDVTFKLKAYMYIAIAI